MKVQAACCDFINEGGHSGWLSRAGLGAGLEDCLRKLLVPPLGMGPWAARHDGFSCNWGTGGSVEMRKEGLLEKRCGLFKVAQPEGEPSLLTSLNPVSFSLPNSGFIAILLGNRARTKSRPGAFLGIAILRRKVSGNHFSLFRA